MEQVDFARDILSCPDVALVLNVRRLMRSLHARAHSRTATDDLSMLCVLVASRRNGRDVPMAATTAAHATAMGSNEGVSSMARLTRSGYVRTAGRRKGSPTYVITMAGIRSIELVRPAIACGYAKDMLDDMPTWIIGRAFSCARASQPANRGIVLIGHLSCDGSNDVAEMTGLSAGTVARHDRALASEGLLAVDGHRWSLTERGVMSALSVASDVQGYVYATGLHDDIESERARQRDKAKLTF